LPGKAAAAILAFPGKAPFLYGPLSSNVRPHQAPAAASLAGGKFVCSACAATLQSSTEGRRQVIPPLVAMFTKVLASAAPPRQVPEKVSSSARPREPSARWAGSAARPLKHPKGCAAVAQRSARLPPPKEQPQVQQPRIGGECGLTLRSRSGPSEAVRLARQGGCRYSRLSGQGALPLRAAQLKR